MNWAPNSEDDVVGYRIYCFDGTEYQPVADADGSSWSSLGADIWPTDAEIADGRYALHADGSGTDLKNDPHQVYTNSPSSTHNDSINYWFAVKAKNRLGNLSELSDPWKPTLPGASGTLLQDETWAGYVRVSGDVTVPDGVTLTIESGAVVQFLANTDNTGSGNDTGKSELIVAGTLDASAADITFRSSNDADDASNSDWYGIHIESGGRATLTNVTIRDGVRCAQAAQGGSLALTNPTLVNCGTPPTISGAQTPTFREHNEAAVATYTATDAESDAVTWSLVDENDDDAFSIDSEGRLRFQTPPDFEAPTAAGHAADADLATRNAYSVTVLAEDGQGASTEYEVTVTVTNEEEPGTVTLSSSQPQVGVPLRADLSDPDGGVNNVRWGWLYSSARGARGVGEEPGGTDRLWSTFTPYSLLVGQQLRARAVYDDGQGADKQAQSALTEPVAGTPDPPGNLTAEVEDGQVTLTWETPADNGSALTGYEYRHSDDGARTWAPDWGTIRGEAETTSHRLERLTNGTEYTFEVRAVNGVGAGDSARGTATPGRAPDPVRNLRRAAAENGQVTLSWVAPVSDGGLALTGYEYRQSSDGTTWAPDWTAVAPPLARSLTRTGLESCTFSTFEVRARNPAGPGDARRVSVPRPYWSGSLAADTAWSGRVCVDGDVTIPAGVTLTLAAETEMAFHPGGDATEGGADQTRSELIVAGTLSAGTGVTFRSVDINFPSTSDWSGIRVDSGGSADLSGATVRDGARCVQAHTSGTVTLTNTTLSPCGQSVSLSSRRSQVGVGLTATLEGETEAVSEARWQWQGRNDRDSAPAWADLAGASQLVSYTPVAADLGHRLRATVRYGPGSGSYSNYAQSAATRVVQGPPPMGFAVWPDHEAVLLLWDASADAPITHWHYGVKEGTEYAWTQVANSEVPATEYGGRMIRYHRIGGLRNTVEYRFKLRAQMDAGLGASTEAVRATPVQPQVAYGASSYEAREGGAAVSVGVALSAQATRAVPLPVTVTADSGTEAGDYTVEGLSAGAAGDYTVSFTLGQSTQTFTLRANVDEDEDDETVSLGLGTLPSGVRAGTPAGATVTLRDAQLPEVVLTVAYSASSYEVWQGGAAVSVGVVLSPATDRAVSIPLTVTADAGTEESAYTVGGLSQGTEAGAYTVSFARDESIQTFTITANVDEDEDDETVSLGLGTLPSGVSAGMPASATVTLREVPQPQNLRATAGNEQVLLEWDDLEDDSVTQWQYRGEQYHPTQRVWTEFRGWTVMDNSPARTTSYTVLDLSPGVRYRFFVRAENPAGPSEASAPAEAVLLTVAYSASSYEAWQGGAAVEVGVVLSPPTDRAVSLPVRVTADSGTEAGDYTVEGLSAGAAGDYTVSFTLGQSTQTFTITANVDEDEDDETVSLGLELEELPEGVRAGTPASATVTLRDAQLPEVVLTVAYSASSYEAWQGGAAVEVGVVLSPPTDRAVSLPVRVTADSGTEAGDYTVEGLSAGAAGDYTVSFTLGQSTQTFTITANVDEDEDDETVSLELEELPEGVRAGTPASATVTLRDAQLPEVVLTVAYSASSYEAWQGGAAVEVGVVLSPPTDQAVSLPVRVTADAGTEASAYTVGGLSPGTEAGAYTVSFTPGQSIQTFTITANVDEDEDDETVSLELEELPEGVRAGTPARATVTLRDVPPTPVLRATAGNEQVLLEWDDPEDDSVTEWQYRGDRYHPAKGVWVGFRPWTTIPGSTAETTSYTVPNLTNGVRYRFFVRAENPAGPSEESNEAEAVLLTVAYSASSYEAWQGGAAVEVGVVLSPPTDRAVSLPVRVTADAGTEASAYTVGGLSPGTEAGAYTVSFIPGQSTQTFTITANEDEDRDDETVSLELGPLPEGVSAGTPASATVTLRDAQLPEVVLTVAYSASSYEATEGGAAVEVGVVLSPPTDRAVSIPVRVTADAGTEASAYTVGGLSPGTEAGAYTVSLSPASPPRPSRSRPTRTRTETMRR